MKIKGSKPAKRCSSPYNDNSILYSHLPVFQLIVFNSSRATANPTWAGRSTWWMTSTSATSLLPAMVRPVSNPRPSSAWPSWCQDYKIFLPQTRRPNKEALGSEMIKILSLSNSLFLKLITKWLASFKSSLSLKNYLPRTQALKLN